MDPSALEYRRQRGLGFKDEQMALLIQRVSGSMYEDFLMPNAAGVGYSYSAYKWDDSIDASDGILRLVMGLGTRAVDRTEGDYPRIVNLSAPERSTLTESWAKHQYSQRYVDLMDYTTKSLSSDHPKTSHHIWILGIKNWYWNTTAMPSGRSVSADSGVRFSLPTAKDLSGIQNLPAV